MSDEQLKLLIEAIERLRGTISSLGDIIIIASLIVAIAIGCNAFIG